jgi:hypothetical protein
MDARNTTETRLLRPLVSISAIAEALDVDVVSILR